MCVQLFVTPWTGGLLCPKDSPGKNTGVGCHALLQGSFMKLVQIQLWEYGHLPYDTRDGII